MTDRDTARTALIEAGAEAFYVMDTRNEWKHAVEGVRGWYRDAATVIVDAIAVARQDVPCETCGDNEGFVTASDGSVAHLIPCPTCHGSGSVPGPLLIDVMTGWEQVPLAPMGVASSSMTGRHPVYQKKPISTKGD